MLDQDLNVRADVAVNFDRDLPQYGTKGGAKYGPNGEAFSPTKMFLEAIDVVFARLAATPNVQTSLIGAVSASGQQHGSVYWRKGSREKMKELNPSEALVDQLGSSFSIENSPIWMDASTATYCREIERAAGGTQALADLTGSKAFRRFTAAQIAKIRKERPDLYRDTERVSLISAFVASVFLQSYAPEDVSDAAGTNLLELRSEPPKWSAKMVEIVGTDLKSKLCSAPVHSYDVIGKIGIYFQQR